MGGFWEFLSKCHLMLLARSRNPKFNVSPFQGEGAGAWECDGIMGCAGHQPDGTERMLRTHQRDAPAGLCGPKSAAGSGFEQLSHAGSPEMGKPWLAAGQKEPSHPKLAQQIFPEQPWPPLSCTRICFLRALPPPGMPCRVQVPA